MNRKLIDADEFRREAKRKKCDFYDCVRNRANKPITNSDRIRAMTDEELATWIVNRTEGNDFDEYEDHVESWLDWLKLEVKESE